MTEPLAQTIGWDEPDEYVSFRRRIRKWYRNEARDLPWRQDSDPYKVWISEIMLQQTQVATVIPYFERFIATFPTVSDLAKGDESLVLRLWEGLGYYRRARQLHRAAQIIEDEHNGNFPTDFKSVIALPGIGRYTAGAIMSIALNQPYPILEGNTIRLHSRLLAFDGIPTRVSDQRQLWTFAEQLVTRKAPGELNQALMELGAKVCTPRAPKCSECPVRMHCQAFDEGTQLDFPRSGKRIEYEDRFEVAIVIECNGHFLLHQCGENDRWAGLWDFCRFEETRLLDKREVSQHVAKVSSRKSRNKTNTSAFDEVTSALKSKPKDDRQQGLFEFDAPSDAALAHRLRLQESAERQTGLELSELSPLLALRHGVTKYRIRLGCYRAYVATAKSASHKKTQRLPQVSAPWRWVQLSRLDEVALCVTGRNIAEQLLNESD